MSKATRTEKRRRKRNAINTPDVRRSPCALQHFIEADKFSHSRFLCAVIEKREITPFGKFVFVKSCEM
jgi:hypothetical protein